MAMQLVCDVCKQPISEGQGRAHLDLLFTGGGGQDFDVHHPDPGVEGTDCFAEVAAALSQLHGSPIAGSTLDRQAAERAAAAAEEPAPAEAQA